MIDDRKPRERQEPKIAMPQRNESDPQHEAAPRSAARTAADRAAKAREQEAPQAVEQAPQVAPEAAREAPPQDVQRESPREAREDAGPESGDLEARLAALEAEKAEIREHLLRALADGENTRRRIQREMDEKLKYAPAALAKDLLSVADNLGRALTAVPPEMREQEAVKGLMAGVEMTEKALLEAFARHGIHRIEPLGQKLDPHRHEAMMEVQDPSRPSGTIAQVFEVGYEMLGRLLRPARVAVAKGGPTGAEPAEPGSTVDTKA